MGRNVYATVAVLVSVAALAMLSLPATDALPSQGTVTGHPQWSAGDPGRLDGSSMWAHNLIEYGQIGYPDSDPVYRNVMIAVAKYDENGWDVSDKNKGIVVKMLRGIDARNIHALEMLSFVTASIPADRILDVSGHDLVYRVDYDEALTYPTIDKMRVTVGATADNLRRHNGTVADGSGVTVGIVDRGVNHPQGINDRVVGRIMCDGLGCDYASPGDVVGPDPANQKVSHGTQVALVVAGSGFPEHNGIAPGVDILDAGFSSRWTGVGDGTISNAFSWLLRNDADVANLSMGTVHCRQSSPDTMRQLIVGEAVDNGMVVVTGAGNTGAVGNSQNRVPVYQSINEWGCTHNVITVGGIDDRDPDNIKMYDKSGRGPATHRVDGVTYLILKPEIVAPAIIQIPRYTANGTTALITGTSIAAPAVTAVAALALQERDMEPVAVKAAILLGANWTGPVPCSSVQYEQNNATDSCSHGRQPGNFTEANNNGSLEIVNNVGFGILNAAKTLDYISQASGRHLVEDSLKSDADINGYRFEVTDTGGGGDPVKIILSWTTDPFYEGLNSRSKASYFADLGFTVDCPGMETISAQSTYQANEFAVFVPAETGTCTVAVTGSGIDTPRRSQQDYAIASTLPLNTVDIAAPRPTISATELSPTNVHNIAFMVDFGEQVNQTTFTASDVSALGGTVSDPLPANSTAGTFTFKISDINTGNLTVSIPEGGVLDPAGNGNIASNPYVIEIERIRPAPVLSTAFFSPVNASHITFTVDFGEQVNRTTFTASDVSASSGTVSDPLPAGGDDTEFTFEVSSLAAGNLTVSLPEGGVLDPAGNNNTASDLYVAEIKRPRPSPVISTTEPSITHVRSITFTVDFGEPVNADTFTASDVSASGGTVSDPLPASSDDTEFTFEVSSLAAGILTVSIPEGGVLDPVGNSNIASDPYVVELEHTRPAPVLSTVSSSPVNASRITLTVDFGEPVNADTFTALDVSASGGTVSDPLPASSDDTEFTFEVSSLAAGILTVSIPEGGVLDPAGNSNIASDPLIFTITSILAGTTPEAAFVTTWKTTSANEFIMIPVVERTGKYTVTWGDASIDTDVSGYQMHTYKNAGTYTVSIYGDFSRIYLPYYPENAPKLQSIEQWGDIRWESMRGAFSGASNMVYRATDAPDLSDVTDTSEMFRFATSFNGNLSTWDVSHVTDMRQMFDIATAFNGDISSWNVSGVTDMSNMFLAARIFTQNLGDWYIVLDETTISDANKMLAISAQNSYLDGQNLVYTIDLIAPGGDKFRIVNGSHLAARADQTVAPGQYNVTIKSTGSFGTDNSKIVGITVSEDVILQTNSLPSVKAGPAQTVQEGSEVSLNGSATDHDKDVMTYLWTHNSTTLDIALANATSASTTFTAPQVDSDTAIIFTLTANDDTATSSDSVIITVTAPVNSPPSVEAGPAQTVQEGSEVSLNGSATDHDKDVMTYLWTHNSTSSDITLANATSASTTFTAPQVDSDTDITFTLTANDDTATSSDSVIITVTAPVNSPPSVKAGPAQTVQEGSEVSLNGSATDHDKDVMTYLWTHNSTTLDIALANATSASTTFTAPQVDSDTAIIFTLTANDDTATSSDSVIITVTAPVNSPPSVEAGPAQTVQEGSEVSLNGSATDHDKDVMTYLWTHNYTSSDITLANATSASTTFTAPQVDSDTDITFTLTANDDTATSSDSVIITVTAPVNSPPSVKAGPAQTVQEGSEVSLNGSATDHDKDVMTYLWTHNSTSSDITLANATSASTTFTAPRVDSDTDITFTLTANDDTATSSDSVIITVTAPVNSPPSVKAGPAQTVQEGSEVSLNGSATDHDKDVMTYLWTHNSTTLDIALANATSASTTFTAPQVDSDTAIIFTLTANDDTATSSDSVIITVTAPVNSPPSVEAGPAQTVQEGSEVSLNGSATDHDKDVMTYLWTHNSTSSDITLANATSASTTFTAPRVDSDTAITFTLTANDDTATSSDSVIITVTAPVNSPPSVKAGPAQTVQEGSEVSLNGSATDHDKDVMTYLWTHNYTSSDITLANATSASTTFTAPQVDSDTDITFTLTADDDAEARSDIVTVTVTDVQANDTQISSVVLEPQEPRGARDIGRIILNSTLPGVIDAAWDAPSETPVDYRLSWAKVDAPFLTWTDLSGNAFPTDTSYTITGLEEDETYKLMMRARYGGTAGDWSGNVAITVAGIATTPVTSDNSTVPGTPRDLVVSRGGNGALTVSWQAPSSDGGLTLTGYVVQWKEAGNIWDVPADVSEETTTATTHTVTGLTNGVSYTVRVLATNQMGSGSHSAEETDTPLATRGIDDLILSSTTPGTIRAAWDAPSEAPADYRLSWAKVGTQFLTWTDLSGNAFPTDTSYTITGLEEDETYKLMVRARYGGTAGDWSGEATIIVARTG